MQLGFGFCERRSGVAALRIVPRGRNKPPRLAVVLSMRTVRLGKRLAVLAALGLLVGCDHVTKHAAKAQLEGSPPRELIHGILDLRYVENRDVAFSLLRFIPEQIRAPLLIVLGAIALAGLTAFVVRKAVDPRVKVALLVVLAGALGNYLDRLVRGYVVDFVHLHHWPVFNVADVYVTAGGLLLAIIALSRRSPPRQVAQDHA